MFLAWGYDPQGTVRCWYERRLPLHKIISLLTRVDSAGLVKRVDRDCGEYHLNYDVLREARVDSPMYY